MKNLDLSPHENPSRKLYLQNEVPPHENFVDGFFGREQRFWDSCQYRPVQPQNIGQTALGGNASLY